MKPQMPSIEIVLPPNVERRARADKTNRYYFRVRRNRPKNWPQAIRFCPGESSGIALSEQDEPIQFFAVLEQWARELNQKLEKERGKSGDELELRGSLPWIWTHYQGTDQYLSKSKPTKDNYKLLAKYVRDWSARLGHPHVRRYAYEGVEAFINGWRDTPYQRRAVQRFLSLLFKHAMRLRLRDDNPASAMGLETPKSKVVIWDETATDFMVSVADAIGHPSIGTAILICHEIGPREGDVISMRAPEHYDNGSFRFTTSKTAAKLTIPATSRLRKRLESDGVPLLRHLVVTDIRKKKYKADNFRHVFAEVRATAGAIMCVQAVAEVFFGAPKAFVDVSNLLYRQLRHTAIVNLARAGCTVPEIASITGHSIKTVTQILEHYLPRDSVVASHAISKLENYRTRTHG
jgi:hypothetical protein